MGGQPYASWEGSPATPGGRSWTPQASAAPISRALPEAQSARATVVSTHVKTSASSVRRAARPAPRRQGRPATACGRQPKASRSGARSWRTAAHCQRSSWPLGFDERPLAAWWARAGHQGQAVQAPLVEPPCARGPVQAAAIRVQTQGGRVWMALAMLVKTRVWRAGEVSTPRDRPVIRRLSERVRRCAARRPLWVGTEGWVSYIRAIRETCREPLPTGTGGRPQLRPWPQVVIA